MKAGKSKKHQFEAYQAKANLQKEFDEYQASAGPDQGVFVIVDPDFPHKTTFHKKTKKELYWREVGIMFDHLVEGFNKDMADLEQEKEEGAAIDKQGYIDEQIEHHEYLFGLKKKDLKYEHKVYHHVLSAFRDLYPKLTRKAKGYRKEYNIKIGSYVNFQKLNAPPPNDIIGMIVPATGTDPYHIEVEAHAKYFEWLKEQGEKRHAKAPKIVLESVPDTPLVDIPLSLEPGKKKSTKAPKKKDSPPPKGPPPPNLEGYTEISVVGELTQEDFTKFISFLYKENNKTKAPFLSKEETQGLSVYGLKVPPKSLKKRLNLDLAQGTKPEQIIFYCFYKLRKRHSPEQNIRGEYAKYLRYNFDNFDRLSISKLKKRFTSIKPDRMKFDIEKYLP